MEGNGGVQWGRSGMKWGQRGPDHCGVNRRVNVEVNGGPLGGNGGVSGARAVLGSPQEQL